MSRLVSFYILLAIIVFIGILFLKVMASFLLPLFLATVLVVVFKPLHNRLCKRYPKRPRLAASATTGIIAIAVIAPLTLAIVFAVAEGTAIVRHFQIDDITPALERIREKVGFDKPHIETVRNLHIAASQGPVPGPDNQAAWLDNIGELARTLMDIETDRSGGPVADEPNWQNFTTALQALHDAPAANPAEFEAGLIELRKSVGELQSQVLGGRFRATAVTFLYPSDAEIQNLMDRLLDSGLDQKLMQLGASTVGLAFHLLFGLAIMLVGIFFFLVDGPRMIDNVMRLSPLADDYEKELVVEFAKVSRAVVLATLLSAIAQGLLAGLGYWFAGLESTFLLTLLTILLAMVPFIGAAAVWLPASLYLMLGTDHVVAGALLAAYGAIPVSLADNIIKPLVLKNHSQLHPLFALLSVLGGVQALGPIGILVGPMVVAFLQTLLNMLHREIGTLEKEAKKKAASG